MSGKNITREMREKIRDLSPEGMPERYPDRSLITQRGSLTMTLPKDAWTDAGYQLDADQNTADTYWYPDEGALVVMLEDGE